MKKIIIITGCFILLSFAKIDRVEKKTNKFLVKTFKDISFDKKQITTNSKNKDEKWFSIMNKTSSEKIGIVETTSAIGRFDKFDFLVLYNPNKTIRKVKVLIYREDHGREIGSKRWLKQFEGKSSKDAGNLNKEIDGISGATMSCNAITNEIKKSLISVQKIN